MDQKKITKQQLERRNAFSTAASQSRQDFRAPVGNRHGKAVKEVFEVDIARIRVDEDQVRQQGKELESSDMQQLAASIQEQGLIQYPEVRYLEDENLYEIIAGERRFLACSKILKWERIPVKVTNITDPLKLWQRQYAENAQRLAVDPIDLAASLCKVMEEHELNQEQTAQMINKSITYVQKIMSVNAKLSDEAKDILAGTKQGESLATVYEVATVPEDDQADIAEQIVTQKLKQREVTQLTSAAKKKKGSKAKGRRAKKRPFETTLKVKTASIHLKFRKSDVENAEVIEALQQAIHQLSPNYGDSKAA